MITSTKPVHSHYTDSAMMRISDILHMLLNDRFTNQWDKNDNYNYDDPNNNNIS